jgi:hypothetical protein
MKSSICWSLLRGPIVLGLVVSLATMFFWSSGHVYASSSTTTPTIKVSRTVVHSAMTIHITGTGFTPQHNVAFSLTPNSWSFAFLDSDNHGNISGQIQLPDSVLAGQHLLIAHDTLHLDWQAAAPLTFKPFVLPTSGKPGMKVQLIGNSFAANETVSVYWGSSSGQLEGTTTSNDNGHINFSLTAPSGLAFGSYPITIMRAQKPKLITTTFKVIPVTLAVTPVIHNGELITVKVTGFLPGENVVISWDAVSGGQEITSIKTDATGAAKSTCVPPTASSGIYTLTATDQSGLQTTAKVTVGPGIALANGSTSGISSGLPGQTVTVYGSGFTAGDTFNVYFQSSSNGVIPATADSTGTFSVSLTIPNSYDPSVHYFVYAVNTAGTVHARTPFTFLKPYLRVSDWDGVNPNTVGYGHNIDINGYNFAEGESVNVIWNYNHAGQSTIATVTADSFGQIFSTLVGPSVPNQNTLVIAAIGATSHLVVTQIVENDAAITVDGSTVPGEMTTIAGGSFGSNDPITITIGGTIVATLTSAADGSFSTSITLPPDPGVGEAILEVKDTAANITVGTTFYYAANLTANPTTLHNGDTITLTGAHFSANSSITLEWGAEGGSPSSDITTDANGSFTAAVQIEDRATGTNTLCATDNTHSTCVDLVVQ